MTMESAKRILALLPGVDCGGFGGCGCTTCEVCAQAIAQGDPITLCPAANTETVEAVKRAIDYTRLGIEHRFKGGKGYGCVGHIFDIDWLRED